MSYQRSKAPLSLMEQLIMVFVFAFAAAVCLQAFVYSDNLSKNSTAKEMAAMRASEVIEVCKSYHGDLDKASQALEAKVDKKAGAENAGDVLTKEYSDDGVRIVLTTNQPEQTNGNGNIMYQTAEVAAWEIVTEGDQPSEPVYKLDVAWQLAEQSKTKEE